MKRLGYLLLALVASACDRVTPLVEPESDPALLEAELEFQEVQSLPRLPREAPTRIGAYAIRIEHVSLTGPHVEVSVTLRRLGPEAGEGWMNPFFFPAGSNQGIGLMLVAFDPGRGLFRALWNGQVDGQPGIPGTTGQEPPGWERRMRVRFAVRSGYVPIYLRLGSFREGVSPLFPFTRYTELRPVALVYLGTKHPGLEGLLPDTALPVGSSVRLYNGWEFSVIGLELTERALPVEGGGPWRPQPGSLWAIVRLRIRCAATSSCVQPPLNPFHLIRPVESSVLLFVGPAPYRPWPGSTAEIGPQLRELELVFRTPQSPWWGGWLLCENFGVYEGHPQRLLFFALPAPESS